jgi:hypothetical protein
VPAASDTLVGRATTDTLTNKTLTSPVVSGGTIDNAVIGGTTTAAGSFTTLTASSTTTLSGGTANGVGYLNGSKVLTTGTAFVFDGTNVGIGTSSPTGISSYPTVDIKGTSGGAIRLGSASVGSYIYTDAAGMTVGTSGATSLNLFTNGTVKATIDSSGNVGIGVTPSAWGTAYRTAIQAGTGACFAGTSSGASDYFAIGGNFYLNSSASYRYINTATANRFEASAGEFRWYNAPSGTAGNAITFTQVMTLDASGNALFNQTTTGYVNINGSYISNQAYIQNHANGTASGSAYVAFGYNATGIGSITQNGTTGVLYNLTSDYRLKNNQQPLTGAKDFVMALQPKKWQWWDGSGEGVGFIAHEFMEVAKYSGHGEKDAVETVEIKDEDGNVTGTEQRAIYQSIQPSSSEVMANIVALIQEQQALITQLQADVAALKAPK